MQETVNTKICKCGAIKDYRAKQCAKCAGKSVPITENGFVLYDDEAIRKVIINSSTFVEASTKIGHSRNTLKRYVIKHNLDISHFKGASGRDVPFDKVFTFYDKRVNASIKRYVLLYKVLKNECTICKSPPMWNGVELNLELHHINGNPLDNTIPNLQLLCPNCHSQTSTNKGKNCIGIKKIKKT
jgi:5-methylcytosine-specific restriction endonuclease McrA